MRNNHLPARPRGRWRLPELIAAAILSLCCVNPLNLSARQTTNPAAAAESVTVGATTNQSEMNWPTAAENSLQRKILVGYMLLLVGVAVIYFRRKRPEGSGPRT
jgi:hypothetical protein